MRRDALVAGCRTLPGGVAPTSEGPAVPVGDACEVPCWDLRDDLDSRGAVLFRRFWNDLAERNEPDSWWARPFDPRDPVRTPGVFDTTRPGVMTALGDAIGDLQAAGVALDARVGDVQHTLAGGRRIPVSGGPGDPNGEFNVIESVFDRAHGFGPVPARLVLRAGGDLARRPCPDSRTVLTYSQSANPRSPYSSDQQAMFGRKAWVREHFCRADVLAHTLDRRS